MEPETVALADAAGRVLAEPAQCRRDLPPFAASAMDGYAMRDSDAGPGATLRVIGQAAAGHGFDGAVGPGEVVRIFTGAPVPQEATLVVMQEDVTSQGDRITLGDYGARTNIRHPGADFRAGDGIAAPRRLRPADLALLAAMNVARVTVARRPVVALIATGDELVMPGEDPSPDQIIASNSLGLKAMAEAEGADARLLPIARDNEDSLRTAFRLAEGADLIVTIGGASAGDYDLVAPVATRLGMQCSFDRIAMRPGGSLMAGRLAGSAMLGLPGNPAASMDCGHIFMLPMLRAMLGMGAAPAARQQAPLAVEIAANGPREHYARARLGAGRIAPIGRQDRTLLSQLTQATALLVRPAHDGARKAGEMVEYIPI